MEIWILISILVLFILWNRMSSRGVKSISTAQLKEMLQDPNKMFIDVRTPGEYKSRHIHVFTNLPLGSDFTGLPQHKELVVICQSGMRSSRACKQMMKLGYKQVVNVQGGMSAWKE